MRDITINPAAYVATLLIGLAVTIVGCFVGFPWWYGVIIMFTWHIILLFMFVLCMIGMTIGMIVELFYSLRRK